MKRLSIFLLFFFSTFALFAQIPEINPKLLRHEWDAAWITHPTVPLTTYGVYHFRHTFDLDSKPASFIVHASADNRYRLFVNGQSVGFGPARGDLLHWRYETYDIAEHLQTGENVVAAVVWNFGEDKPVAQHTYYTGFILQGNTEAEHIVNSGNGAWKVVQNQAYQPLTQRDFTVLGYYAVGATDHVDGSQYPWDWEQLSFDDSDWLKPRNIKKGAPYGFPYGYGDGGYNLVPRNIPMMEEYVERFKEVERSEGSMVAEGFVQGQQPWKIPANTKASVLLDQTYLVAGYPELKVSGGAGSRIKITYSEALYDEQNRKGNRNETEGKHIVGYYDIFELDGGENRSFRPLWNRTYRYVTLEVETGSEPLSVLDFYGIYANYPFEEVGMFSSNDATTEDIWEVGWRTARLCATETYMDCPYYEQLQYIGDTRIQALISLYVSGDDRLMRNAIQQFDHSRAPEGITMSRYPSGLAQYIPPYAFFWIAMVHDYHMYRKDDAFVKTMLPGIESVLTWFEDQLDENDLLGGLLWWNYADAVEGFSRGTPPGAEDGHSTLLTLQFIYAADYAVELFESYGKSYLADHYRELSRQMKTAVMESSYDEAKKLIADTPDKASFSQHTNIMAILTDTAPEAMQEVLFDQLIADTSLVQCNIYYRFYLTRAANKVGKADYFVNHMDTWTDMLDEGLTTFAEHEENTRSDCHAWSASPNYEFLATVVGIMPASPHFASVQIAPALGYLQEVSGSIPHPLGQLEVKLKRKGKVGIQGSVSLPEGASGTFVWKGKTIPLKGGKQEVNIP
ncbi:family 78 glycoside hydrolase catalytic domain [Catalinimonas niigatensis]|uniref:family 78 glycoside hydrolase catalytic domain n=1 Tax=Catalinimonas niigatensis TaxID=1397264 RepID=UPI0026658907|nr:family 78 glycoside hydrolase catalytic domain [Catalinimonas niigatensis]WPP53256.1 family 78 glycoside hydrolase catalytic domain [Catalinimonas niigatensis]